MIRNFTVKREADLITIQKIENPSIEVTLKIGQGIPQIIKIDVINSQCDPHSILNDLRDMAEVIESYDFGC